jgi:hypothetical protein
MSLRNGCARPNHFPTLAPKARQEHRPHPTIDQAGGRSSVWGKAAYAGGLTGAINVEDHPGVALSIHQPSGLLVVGEWASEQIIEKERP